MPYSIAMTPLTDNGNNGFGGDGAWWLIILFLFAFCGWGGNWGGNGAGGVSENYTLISDMGQLDNKIDRVYTGLCDATFSLNNTATNGFAAAQSTMTQGFAGINTGMIQQGNSITAAIKDCCCTTQQNLKDVNYNLAT